MLDKPGILYRSLNALTRNAANHSKQIGFLFSLKDFHHIRLSTSMEQFATLSQRLLTKVQPAAADNYCKVPYDIYCPSMKEKLKKGICSTCQSYWPSQAAMQRHRKCHRASVVSYATVSDEDESESWIESSEDEPENIAQDDSIEERMRVYDKIFDILQGPFFNL